MKKTIYRIIISLIGFKDQTQTQFDEVCVMVCMIGTGNRK